MRDRGPMSEIRHLDDFLRHFHEEYSSTSVAALRVYLVVCEHALLGTAPEKLPSLGEIAKRLGLPAPTLTHIVQMFCEGSRKIGPPGGMQLMTRQLVKGSKRLTLTQSGRSVMQYLFPAQDGRAVRSGARRLLRNTRGDASARPERLSRT
jgi:hypothetical protein